MWVDASQLDARQPIRTSVSETKEAVYRPMRGASWDEEQTKWKCYLKIRQILISKSTPELFGSWWKFLRSVCSTSPFICKTHKPIGTLSRICFLKYQFVSDLGWGRRAVHRMTDAPHRCVFIPNTVRCRYNAGNFRKRHTIFRPLVQGMVCVLYI